VKNLLKLFAWLQSTASTSLRREEGQTMAEYGVILAVITAAIIGALVLLSDNIFGVLDQVAKAIKAR
jgi:Flp pilus assembly pilin Flp